MIGVATLEAASVVLFMLSQYRGNGVEYSAWIVPSAHGIIAVSDGQSYNTWYQCCRVFLKWTFIPYIFERVCAVHTLVDVFVGQF